MTSDINKQFANNVSRVQYMDVFRGIGIILMIMGHIWFGTYFDIFKAAFHMPMFFFISGFFFQHKISDQEKIASHTYISLGIFQAISG